MIINNIAQLCEIKKISYNYPMSSKALKAYHKHLTYISFGIIASIVLFINIAENYVMQDSLILLDQGIANLMPLVRTFGLTLSFLLITSLGTELITSLVLIGVLVYLFLRKKMLYFWPLAVTFCSAGLFNYAAKYFFHRPRPEQAVYFEASYSFPSCHATLALAFYGFIFFVLWKETKAPALKKIILTGGIILIALIGFSRIYLGVHYLSDVIAGYFLGLIFLLLGMLLVERKTLHKKKSL